MSIVAPYLWGNGVVGERQAAGLEGFHASTEVGQVPNDHEAEQEGHHRLREGRSIATRNNHRASIVIAPSSFGVADKVMFLDFNMDNTFCNTSYYPIL